MNTRPATLIDSEFVYQVKVDALKSYVELTWGWDEAFQRKFHNEVFDFEETEIIMQGCEAVGFLIIKEESQSIELKEINLLQAFQRKGMGSSIIKEVLLKAKHEGKFVRLQVLKVNPAIELYQRLGFAVFEETETHYLMRSSLGISHAF